MGHYFTQCFIRFSINTHMFNSCFFVWFVCLVIELLSDEVMNLSHQHLLCPHHDRSAAVAGAVFSLDTPVLLLASRLTTGFVRLLCVIWSNP